MSNAPSLELVEQRGVRGIIDDEQIEGVQGNEMVQRDLARASVVDEDVLPRRHVEHRSLAGDDSVLSCRGADRQSVAVLECLAVQPACTIGGAYERSAHHATKPISAASSASSTNSSGLTQRSTG